MPEYQCSEPWCHDPPGPMLGCTEIHVCVECRGDESTEACKARAEEEATALKAPGGALPENCTGC